MTRNSPRLDREEELTLFRRWKDDGDSVAHDRLVRSLLRNVVAVALKYRSYGPELSELIAEGNLGLLQALEKFDPERGYRVVTYAEHWIRAYVLERVLRSWSIVGGGSGALRTKLFFKLRRERARITNVVGEGPEADRLLSQRLGIAPDRLDGLLRRIEARDLSLDGTVQQDGSMRWVDTLESLEVGQEERVVNEETTRRLRDVVGGALAFLDVRERFIVERHLMSDQDEELSLAEIGRNLGVSRERVRQLEARACRKLRRRLEELGKSRARERQPFGFDSALSPGARAA
ncbi:MAG TPA: sigma-70 family RNA polymerase sigma factor [Polyangiaceae bacterium]|nr:sigma-70 family RNA polymerase sigma factor [Polyangiaceae bacterium]